MAHIHTEDGQHDTTVTAYIMLKDDTEPKALLHMHRKLQMLLPVGGHVELHENPWQSVSHELEEESGYHMSELKILQPVERIKSLKNVKLHPYPVILHTHEIPDQHYHTDTVYAFTVTSVPKGIVADGESADLRWYTRSELSALTDKEIYPDTKTVYEYIFDVCLNRWEEVPTQLFVL